MAYCATMPTRDDAVKALRFIMAKAPALAIPADKALRYRDDKNTLTAAAKLCREALSMSGFNQSERGLMARIAADVDDETRSVTLRVRLSPSEFAAVEAQSEAEGFTTMSEWARMKMGFS